jgi:protein-tyrosine phosphatase
MRKESELEKIAKTITKIDDKLYISGSISDYNELERLGINKVINCRAECHDDIYELSRRGIGYYWIPVNDFEAPRFDQFDAVEDILRNGTSFDKILIHCAIGLGRAIIISSIYMIYHKGCTIDEALEWLGHERGILFPTKEQKTKLEKYIKYVNNGRKLKEIKD